LTSIAAVDEHLLAEIVAAFGECHPAILDHMSRRINTDYGVLVRLVGEEPAWRLEGKCRRCQAPALSTRIETFTELNAQLATFTPSEHHMQAVWHRPLEEENEPTTST
jgi:hypothetical protein